MTIMANQNEWATITAENIVDVLTRRFAAGVPGEGLTLSCHEAHMLIAYFQRGPDAKDAIPPVSEGATARMLTGLELGGHMCGCGHCSHQHFKNHPLAAIRDGCSACNCTEFVPVPEPDASPVKEERDGQ
jgi:hypothetical protein